MHLNTAARQQHDLVVGPELFRGGPQCFPNLLHGRQHDHVIGAEPGVHGIKAETSSTTGGHKRCTTR
jgi:predicted amidohydrolase